MTVPDSLKFCLREQIGLQQMWDILLTEAWVTQQRYYYNVIIHKKFSIGQKFQPSKSSCSQDIPIPSFQSSIVS